MLPGEPRIPRLIQPDAYLSKILLVPGIMTNSFFLLASFGMQSSQ